MTRCSNRLTLSLDAPVQQCVLLDTHKGLCKVEMEIRGMFLRIEWGRRLVKGGVEKK